MELWGSSTAWAVSTMMGVFSDLGLCPTPAPLAHAAGAMENPSMSVRCTPKHNRTRDTNAQYGRHVLFLYRTKKTRCINSFNDDPNQSSICTGYCGLDHYLVVVRLLTSTPYLPRTLKNTRWCFATGGSLKRLLRFKSHPSTSPTIPLTRLHSQCDTSINS